MVAPNESSGSHSDVSPRKARANRLNAAKSTGPRSAEGKARSSQNARTHGLFSRRVVLPGEEIQEFLDLREQLRRCLRPQDLLELSLVDDIAVAQWRIARARAAEAGMLQTCPEFAQRQMSRREREQAAGDPNAPARALALALECRDNPVDRLARYEQRLHYQVHRNLRELERLRGKPRAGWADLPPGPYVRGDRDDEQSHEEHEFTECNQSSPEATDDPKMQNEATGDAPPTSPPPAKAYASRPDPLNPPAPARDLDEELDHAIREDADTHGDVDRSR